MCVHCKSVNNVLILKETILRLLTRNKNKLIYNPRVTATNSCYNIAE